MTYDGATWGAFACVLSALAGVLTWQAYRRRGLASAIHGAGWTLLPIAAWLTGTLRLAVEVLNDVGDWATRLVFSPTVWLGIVLAGVAVVLIGGGGAASRRIRGHRRSERRATAAATATDDTPPRVERRGSRKDAPAGEFDEIEAILRKHGIS